MKIWHYRKISFSYITASVISGHCCFYSFLKYLQWHALFLYDNYFSNQVTQCLSHAGPENISQCCHQGFTQRKGGGGTPWNFPTPEKVSPLQKKSIPSPSDSVLSYYCLPSLLSHILQIGVKWIFLLGHLC